MSETTTVPRLHKPDLAEFRRSFEAAQQPAVITGAMDNWRALDAWSQDYFAEHLGDVRVTVMTAEEETEDDPFGPEQLKRLQIDKLTIREYLQEVSSGPVRRYVSGMPLQPDLPMLLDDIELPEYREEGSTASPRMWFGRGVGPLHYDRSSNLHGIVYGGKRFTLFHPKHLPDLYPCSMFSIIPTMSRLSLSQPDYERFPRLRKAEALVVDLAPGELIFLPAGWWHQVTTPTLTISIDFPWTKNPRLGRPFLRLIPWRLLTHFRGRLGSSN